MLRQQDVHAHLQTAALGRSLLIKGEVTSTNDLAKAAALAGAAHGHTIVADSQTAGRGAQGRTWSSPPGLDLYVSVVLRLELPPAQWPALTLAAGLAVSDCATLFADQPAQVKWPNDVWLAGRKCAGVLTEGTSRGDVLEALVVGVGLNINRVQFSEELASTSTSLRIAHGGTQIFDRAQVLAVLLKQLEDWVQRYQNFGMHALLPTLNARLALVGERVQCGGHTGVLRGLAASGALRLSTGAGETEILSGTLRPFADPIDCAS